MTNVEPYRDLAERSAVTVTPVRRDVSSSRDNIDFAWLLGTFRRRIWTFLGTIVITLAAALVFMLFYPPLYEATARVTINQRPLLATPDKESPVVAPLPNLSNNIDTETQVIASRRVAKLVVQRLALDKDPEFSSTHIGMKQALADFFTMLHPQRRISENDRVIDAVLANLDPERFLETNAIDINFKDNNPVKAQKIANAFSQAYLDSQVASKVLENRKASGALRMQLDQMRNQAANDAKKVQDYKISHNLLSVGAQTLTEQEISGYDQAVATAKVDAAADEANLRTAQRQLASGSSGGDVGQALASPVITDLRSQRAQLGAKLASLEGHYGPKYPDLAQTRRQVSELDQQIAAEIERTVSNLSAKARISQQRLASMEGTRDQTQKVLAGNNAAQAGLDDLTRTAMVSQTIYQAYLQRFQESLAQEPSLAPDAEVVSIAGLPSAAMFPDPILFPALAFVAAFLLACAAVLLAQLLDTRIYSARDVELRLGRPYLGGIPRQTGGRPLDALIDAPFGAFSDAIRGLAASTRFFGARFSKGLVVVSSALPGEGRTTIAAGLAFTSALQGTTTLLVDADLRGRDRVETLGFGSKIAGAGLLAVLSGDVDLSHAISVDEKTGAHLLSFRGREMPQDDMLGGSAMDALLTEARRRYAAIFIDAPPLSIALARTLADKADAVIIVAPYRCNPDDGLTAALNLPPLDHITRLGIALNRVVRSKHSGRRLTRLFRSDTATGREHA